MDNDEINCLLKNDKYFIGSFALDQVPVIQTKPATIIINTDTSDRPGEHWVAIYFKKNGKGIYFDSYGIKPLQHQLTLLLNEECYNGWKYNNVALQSASPSFTCGHYCVLFCKAISAGTGFRKFIDLFSTNRFLNDIITYLAVTQDKTCFKNHPMTI